MFLKHITIICYHMVREFYINFFKLKINYYVKFITWNQIFELTKTINIATIVIGYCLQIKVHILFIPECQ